jgi:chromate transporter
MRKVISNFRKNKDLYLIALKLGLTGFGGLAIIDKIHEEYVAKRKIISKQKFLHTLSLAQVLPGSTIINLIAFFSYSSAGLIGALIGTILYILPTFIITTFFSAIYFHYSPAEYVIKIVQSLNILLISLLINALFNMGKSVFIRKRGVDYRSITISIICFCLYFFYNLSVIMLFLISGILGVVMYTFTGFFKVPLTDLEVAEGTFFKHKRAWVLLIILLVFFTFSIAYISTPLWVLFSSFFKIGLLSFGGGIAAIPLIENIFVKNLHLFSLTEFWDGISISQITPGPIFIVSAFFGYKVAGFWGALIATIGICIPSVVLIILVGKIHDRIKRNAVIRGIIRGFLAGFMGILATLIIGQIQRSIVNWETFLLASTTFLILVKIKKGFILALMMCLLYSFLFNIH